MIKLTFLIQVLLLWHFASSKSMLDEINSNRDFSEFAKAIQASPELLRLLLKERSYTAFVPNNEAMELYKTSHEGEIGERFVRYHLVNRAYKIQDLPEELGTDLEGNPFVYITKRPSNKKSLTGWEDNDYFINNAKVTAANLEVKGSNNRPQYIHTIDRALAPTIPMKPDPTLSYTNPDALMLLFNSAVYGLRNELSIRSIEKKIMDLKANESFSLSGKNTFFIPTDAGFKQFVGNEKDTYTRQTIHGHVIPDEVLFTRTTDGRKQQFKTLAMTDGLKVYLELENVTNSEKDDAAYYVSSYTIEGGPQHVKGSSVSRIVKANIPVKNGVVHLIDRPLMMVPATIMSYLQIRDGQMSKFHRLLADYYPDLINLLVTKRDLTLFAPSNAAFDVVNKERLQKVIANRENLTKMLRLHVVSRRLMTEEIVERSLREIFQEETMSEGRSLYFAVNDFNSLVPVVSVEGAGVNATITTPNIVTKSGMIHIIDRILGIPSQTVFEKLQSDPMLQSTFELGNQRGWINQLKDTKKKFTLFVPNQQAWEYIQREMPSSHRKLFMGSYPKHASNILERHMIVHEALSLEELSALTMNSSEAALEDIRQTRLQMTRGKIYFQAKVMKNFGEYYLEWNGMTARVIRPDLECTNGVVHVIDRVLMSRNDVTVNSAESEFVTHSMILFSGLVAWMLK